MSKNVSHTAPRDVLVIGGGPAGSTAATVLAQRGHRVRLVEKSAHPRFHIGESLLPENLKLLETLGVLEEVRAIGVRKGGAEFIADPDGASHIFYFKQSIDNAYPHAFQVKREEFDTILFRNAAKHGVETHENTRVTRVCFAEDADRVTEVEVEKDGEKTRWQADWVIDASGRDTLFANALKSKTHNKHNNTAAIYGHFRHVTPMPKDEEGHIRIHLSHQGWMWMIPLQHGITSVGVVASPEYLKQRQGSLEEFFMAHCRNNPHVWKRMEPAVLEGDIHATGNYSYHSQKLYGENYALVGDAFGFIDPVFSTGVLLAMTSGYEVASLFCDYADAPEKRARALDVFRKRHEKRMERISWFIYRINCPAFRQLVVNPRNMFRIEEAVVSMLSGDFRAGWKFTFPLLLFKGIYRIKRSDSAPQKAGQTA